MKEYTISVGQSRTATAWPNKVTSWEKLTSRLSRCKRTAETVAEYKAMSKPQRGKVKDIGGFVGGVIRDGGRRKSDSVVSRSLITLDIDFGTKSTLNVVREMLDGWAWCLYSTHSHTPEAPRYRLVLPLSREVSPEEYIPIARRVADDVGIDLFDSSTYEPGRLMYWPSCPKDGEYVYEVAEGDPLDADKALATYTDWRNVIEWPVDSRTVAVTKGSAGAKQEDPTEKPGIIGAFCRTYSVTEAIEAFLSDVYAPTGHSDRWTYIQGSTEGGLVIYEDKWAYSHHGTDPCCEKLVNAFDMVRLHLFGELDKDSNIDTPVNRLPSFLAMEKKAREDGAVAAKLAREKILSLQEDFGDVEIPEETEDWRALLKMDAKGKAFLPSPYNFGLICRNDPGLKGAYALDTFAGRIVILKDLPWRKRSLDPFWNNSDDAGLIEYVNAHYDLASKTTLLDANDIAIVDRSFHPVQDYLRGLHWDGKERLDTLIIDYLGAEDTPLTRAMTRKHFTAAVARVMRPGVKYDYVLTLIGAEGSGKSTLIRKMAMDKWFNDSLTSIDGKEAMEQLRGKWLIEMGELTNYKKSTSEAYKAFLSKQDDQFRPAYGRKTEVYPRQCVFFATTNEKAFLKGDTGNRRFWVIECSVDLPAKDVFNDLDAEVGQIWAEAKYRWEQGEDLFLDVKMEAEAKIRQEDHNEITADDRAGMIEEFIHKPLPATWSSLTMDQRRAWFQTNSEMTPDEPRIKRETICALEILVECLGQKTDEKTRYKTKEINQILRKLDCLEDIGRTYEPGYGRQRRYKILDEPF